jgi:hypothetical protein
VVCKSQCEFEGFFGSPEDNPPKWLLVIRAYLDETGQSEREYVFIAGHIGGETQWQQFVPAWQAALGSQRKRLHMQSLRWNTGRTEQLLARLGPVPAQCGLIRLVGGVRVSDYDDLLSGDRDRKQIAGYPCALLAVITTLMLRSIPPGERYEIIMEQQDRYALHAQAAFMTCHQNPDPKWRNSDGLWKLAKWSFAASESTMLFDQADYLCYALAAQHKDAQSRKARWCAPILESGGETIGRIMSRDEIREAIISQKYPRLKV